MRRENVCCRRCRQKRFIIVKRIIERCIIATYHRCRSTIQLHDLCSTILCTLIIKRLQKIPSHFHFRPGDWFIPLTSHPSNAQWSCRSSGHQSPPSGLYLEPKNMRSHSCNKHYHYNNILHGSRAKTLCNGSVSRYYFLLPRHSNLTCTPCIHLYYTGFYLFIHPPTTDLSRASTFVFTVCILHTRSCMMYIYVYERIGNENRLVLWRPWTGVAGRGIFALVQPNHLRERCTALEEYT
jgi:hypothetical protein